MAAPATPNWQMQLLHALGARPTPQNLLFLNDWARAEGGSASNNPFNTTQPAPGASSYNSVGVRNYLSPDQGVQATLQTLENGRYGDIVAALKHGTSAAEAAKALAASPWGTGSLVLKMLGGQPAAAQPDTGQTVQPHTAARQPQMQVRVAPPVDPRGALLAALSAADGNYGGFYAKFGQALQQRNQPPQQTLPASLARPPVQTLPGRPGQQPPVQTLPDRGLKLAAVPLTLATRGGIQVDQRVLPQVQQIAQQFGVKANSGFRSGEHNAQVGGASNSDHLRGDAVDFTGSPQQMQQLYRWAQGRFPYVEPWAQASGNHVHISFRR